MKVSQLGEFGLIERINSKNPVKDKAVIVGIGDDAAAVKVGAQTVLWTTDTLVEGTHFDLRYSTYFELGWKLLAVNLSDIAAMGGVPKYALITMGLNNKLNVKDIDDLYKGINALARKFGVHVIGGDIVSSPKSIFFTMDVMGYAHNIVRRSGAKAGDMIVSLGKFGASAMGLDFLKRHGRKGKAIKAHLMPSPMLKEGRLASRYATAMIDNSDGLARCLIEICKASKVGARIYEQKVPVDKGATLKQALEGGEDYNLVITVPRNKVRLVRGGVVIGEIIKEKSICLIDKNGNKHILRSRGYEQI